LRVALAEHREAAQLSHEILLHLTAILVLGILAQWIAWRVRLPSILALLATGIVAGPVTGWLEPNELFGNLMLPLVSLSVAVILYEGGLNLKLHELHEIGNVFIRLTTIGAAIAWLVGTVAAHFILDFQWPVATLLGAILVVTGPTVIGPILRHLRLRGKVSALLKWEGIIIDPVGATLAVLVFTVVQAGVSSEGFHDAAIDLAQTLGIGMVAGFLAAGILILVLARFWVPDALHNPVSLMLMFAAFTTSSARLQLDQLRELGWDSFAFVAVMILAARPLSVLVATWRSTLTWQERFFLCCMAPRGIVAAAISSVFALSLVREGYPDAVKIVPVTFLVVFVTVLLYGLAASPIARWLGLTQANPQGILFVGADPWVQTVAKALHDEGCRVLLIDTDWENLSQCRMAGLPCLYGSALAEAAREEIDYTGLGRMLAVTSNNEVNSLACLHYAEDFGRQEVYQLPFSPFKPCTTRERVISQGYILDA